MSEQHPDWLEDALRQEPRYLDDNGFSARVAAALPVRRQHPWWRTVILGSTAAVAVVVGLYVLQGGSYLVSAGLALLRAHSLATLPLTPLLLLVGCLGGLVAFAWSES